MRGETVEFSEDFVGIQYDKLDFLYNFFISILSNVSGGRW